MFIFVFTVCRLFFFLLVLYRCNTVWQQRTFYSCCLILLHGLVSKLYFSICRHMIAQLTIYSVLQKMFFKKFEWFSIYLLVITIDGILYSVLNMWFVKFKEVTSIWHIPNMLFIEEHDKSDNYMYKWSFSAFCENKVKGAAG